MQKSETLRGVLSDKEWNRLAHKNARHGALFHIETGNTKKIAETLKDMPVLSALQFLFKAAETYRKQNRMKQVATILEAAALIDRKTGQEADIVFKETGQGNKQSSTVFIGRFTPKEIFASPIERKEHGIKEYKAIKIPPAKSKKARSKGKKEKVSTKKKKAKSVQSL